MAEPVVLLVDPPMPTSNDPFYYLLVACRDHFLLDTLAALVLHRYSFHFPRADPFTLAYHVCTTILANRPTETLPHVCFDIQFEWQKNVDF